MNLIFFTKLAPRAFQSIGFNVRGMMMCHHIEFFFSSFFFCLLKRGHLCLMFAKPGNFCPFLSVSVCFLLLYFVIFCRFLSVWGFSWYWWYYPYTMRDLVSPVCRILNPGQDPKYRPLSTGTLFSRISRVLKSEKQAAT